jgi:hypothetical protein
MIIEHIVKMLTLDEHIGRSELIELAKGKYKIETSIKRVYKQAMRELYMKRHGRNKGS